MYTELARAIGITRGVASLTGVKIDKYFWVDATRTTHWRGPIIAYATLGTLTAIPAAQSIGGNVVTPLKADKLVVLRGAYGPAAARVQHWLLATSFLTAPTAL